MTNGEKMIKVTELLARMIECQDYICRCNYCVFRDYSDCESQDCKEGIKTWLESESERRETVYKLIKKGERKNGKRKNRRTEPGDQ